MKGAAQERDVAPDGLAACQAADGLVDDRLENRGGQVFLGRAFVDQGLDIGLGKNTAARCDGIQGSVVPGVFVEACGVSLQQRGHLVDERARAAGADPVHALLYVPVLKIDDLGVLAAQFDRDVGLGRRFFERRRDGDHFLHEGDLQIVGQREAAGTCDDGVDRAVAELLHCFGQKGMERSSDIGVMAPVIRKEQSMAGIQDRDLDGRRTNINS